jgi:hypothetical protein
MLKTLQELWQLSQYDDQAMGWTTSVQFLAGAGTSPHQRIKTSAGAHPASCSWDTVGSFPRVKQLGHKTDCSPPSSAEVKNVWSYTSIPQYTFMVWCFFIKQLICLHDVVSS